MGAFAAPNRTSARSSASDSPTALWACNSWFCRARGPFWVKTLGEAKIGARAHAAQKFLGVWSHQAAVCTLHDKNFGTFLRKRRP